jgi:hypothetical protein
MASLNRISLDKISLAEISFKQISLDQISLKKISPRKAQRGTGVSDHGALGHIPVPSAELVST